MSAPPPIQPGQLSPDGRWRWDGARWEATTAVPATRRSSVHVGWFAGGCALIAVLVIAGIAFAAAPIITKLQRTGFSCLPSDFPTYPGATIDSFSSAYNAPTPGSSCLMGFRSTNSTSVVLDFYERRLDTSTWQVTSSNLDAGQISFRNVTRTKTTGTIKVAAKDGNTEITVQLYSP